MNALAQTEQAEEYINRFALRELVEEWLSRASVECPEDPYQYLIDEATDQRRSAGGIVTCPNKWCNMTMPAARFADHQKTCNNAANWVRCVRCNLRVDAAKLSQHRLFCKLERCTFCGEMVLPRMLPMCPYRKVAKAERDRQAALHRRERRLEREALSASPNSDAAVSDGAKSFPLALPAPPPPPPAAAAPASSNKVVTTSLAAPLSHTPMSTPGSGELEVAMHNTEVRPIIKTSFHAAVATAASARQAKSPSPPGHASASSSVDQGSENALVSPTSVRVVAPDDGVLRRGKSTSERTLSEGSAGLLVTGSMADTGSSGTPAVPRPSFPAFLAADAALQDTLEKYPDKLVSVLSTVQTLWRRNTTLHLFREHVFSAVWRHMDSAQEGATGPGKEGAAIRMVERNIRSDRRVSSIDEAGCSAAGRRYSSSGPAGMACSMTGGVGAGGPSGLAKDADFCADEEPNPSFQSDPVHVSDTPLGSSGSYMRIRDFEALTRHCQAREVLQFSVVLKLVRAATRVLKRRPLVQHIAIPAKSSLVVVGDIHGQMKDLEYIINYMGLPSAERFYLFNGDFIDRGPYGCEVLMFIYGLLCTYPHYVFLNRGNHENYSTNTEYGFMAELYAKYAGRASYLLDAMTDSYEVMPLMSIIDHRVAVVHGGVPRLKCTLDEIEAIGHVRDVPVEQQSTRAEQLLAELLWNDPVEKFRSRQLGMNHQGDGWRSSSRGCGVEYLTSITEQFLKHTDLKLVIRSHDVKSAGFELVHKNKSITVFSASNYGGVSGNRGAVAVLTKEAEQPVFHTWFLKEDYREHQQDAVLDGGIDVFLQDDRMRQRNGGAGSLVTTGSRGSSGALTTTNNGPLAFNGSPQSTQKRMNAAVLAEAALMDGDEYICAYYLSSGVVMDEEDAISDTSSRSSAFSDSEERLGGDAPDGTASTSGVNGAAAARGSVVRIRPSSKKGNSASGSNVPGQRWPTGGGGGGGGATSSSGAGGGVPAGARAAHVSLGSYSSQNSLGFGRLGCALAQDMSVVLQLQTLQQIRELIYFQRYALLVAFNQVDEMHTGTVYKAEWCVVMRDVLKLDIPWYYLCQFLAPRLVVDGVPSVEYMRFLRHFDVRFAVDFRLSWQRSTIQRISSGLDIPEDIISAFCERPNMNVSMTALQNPNATVTSSNGDAADKEARSTRSQPDPFMISPLTTTNLEFPGAPEVLGERPSAGSASASLERPWNFAAAHGGGDAPMFANPLLSEEDEDWWCDVQLDFKTFAMKVRVLSPAAAAMEDNEIFALFCFFDVSMQGHVYVGDLVNSVIAVMDEEGSVGEAELLVSGEIDFSAIAGGGRNADGHSEGRDPRDPSSGSSSSSGNADFSYGGGPDKNNIKTNAATSPKSISATTAADGMADEPAGYRGLFASKLKMQGGKPRLMRPPSSDEDESPSLGAPDDNVKKEKRRSSSSSSGDDSGETRLAKAHEETRVLAPSPKARDADDCTRAYTIASLSPMDDFFAKVGSDDFVVATGATSPNTNPSSHTARGSAASPRHPLHPGSSVATDSITSIASTLPTVTARNSDVATAATLGGPPRASLVNTEEREHSSSGSAAAPSALADTARAENADLPGSSPVWVLPLDYDDGEDDPNDAGATVPPEPAVPDTPPLLSLEEEGGLLDAADEVSVVDAGSGVSNLIVAGEGVGSGLLQSRVSSRGGGGGGVAGKAAPVVPGGTLQRTHSFTEYATSMTSACSVSAAAMALSRPFDDYTGSFVQANGQQAGGGGGISENLGGFATVSGGMLTVEQRVNKRLAVPPWIYPTLLRVQEQLLGGYTRLRFLFQALNRSRNGHLTEAEFLPLMEFMNCLLEHPLSGDQAHMLFICVHDSAIGYVHTMRHRRRRRSGSLYSDGFEAALGARRSPAGSNATGDRFKSAADGGDSNVNDGAAAAAGDHYSYTRYRAISEQTRGERYILLVEFLAFFCVRPVQHEDEVEGLEELYYEATHGGAAATVVSGFDNVVDGGVAQGMRHVSPAPLDLDGTAASLSSVSATVSAGMPRAAASAMAVVDGTAAATPSPAVLWVKGQSAETPTPAPGADVATRPLSAGAVAAMTSYGTTRQRRRSSTVTPPFTLLPTDGDSSAMRPSLHLGSDLQSTPTGDHSNSFSSNRQRLSSWVPAETGGSFFHAVTGATRSAAGSQHLHHIPHCGSSVVAGAALSQSGSRAGNGSEPPTAAAAPARADSALPSPALSFVDSAAIAPRLAVMPASIDVFTALASFGDMYGEDITLKELMQLVAARQPRRSRVSLRPHHPAPPHHLPEVLGASSLTSIASAWSDGTEGGGGGGGGGGDNHANSQARKQRARRAKAGERQSPRSHPQPPSPPPHQQQLQVNARTRQNGTSGQQSPVASSPSPAPVSPDRAPTGRSPRPLKGLGRVDGGGGSPANDADFSLASLQATQAVHKRGDNPNATLPSYSLPAAPVPSTMLATSGYRSHEVSSHRSSSFLEMGIAALSARPYMLNQAAEQRVTVMSATPFATRLTSHTPSQTSGLGMSMANLAAGGVPGASPIEKRGSNDSRRSIVTTLPVHGAGFRPRVTGAASSKHGAMMVTGNGANWEGELTSMSLVPSVVLPPAPPTRQRTFHNGNSATLSDTSHMSYASRGSRASRVSRASRFSQASSTMSDYRKACRNSVSSSSATSGSATAAATGEPLKTRLPPPPPTTSILETSVSSAKSSGTPHSRSASANPASGRKIPQSSSSTTTAAAAAASATRAAPPAATASPPSPTRVSPTRPTSRRLARNEKVSVTEPSTPRQPPKPAAAASEGKQRSSVGRSLPRPPSGPATPPTGATQQGPTTAEGETRKAVVVKGSPTEPSRAKAKLDNYIATAKAMQTRSPVVAATGATPAEEGGATAASPTLGEAGNMKPSIPAPPPLQLPHNKTSEAGAAAKSRSARPVALAMSGAKPAATNGTSDKGGSAGDVSGGGGKAEVHTKLVNPLFDGKRTSSNHPPEILERLVVDGQSGPGGNGISSSGGAAFAETTHPSSSTVDSGAPHSCTSTVGPPTLSTTLSNSRGAPSSVVHSPSNPNSNSSSAHASRSTLSRSSANPSTGGSPLQREGLPVSKGKEREKEGHGGGVGGDDGEGRTAVSTTARAAKKPAEGRAKTKLSAAAAAQPPPTPSATARGKKSAPAEGNVSAKSANTAAAAAVAAAQSESSCSNNSIHSSVSSTRKEKKGSSAAAQDASTTTTTTAAAAAAPPTPSNDKSAGAHAGSHARSSHRRLPVKAGLTTTDAMQRMYGGGGGGGKSRTSNSGPAANGGASRSTARGSVATAASRRVTTTAATAENSSADVAASTTTAPSSSIDSEAPGGSADSPTARSAASAGRGPVRTSKVRRSRATAAANGGGGGSSSRSRSAGAGEEAASAPPLPPPPDPAASTASLAATRAHTVSALPVVLHSSSQEALPAIEKNASCGNSCDVVSPHESPRGRDASGVGGPAAGGTAFPVLPPPSSSPLGGGALGKEAVNNNGTAAAAAASVTGEGASAGPARGKNRVAAPGPAHLKLREEDARLSSVCSQSALSPPHHKGRILSPLAPLSKR